MFLHNQEEERVTQSSIRQKCYLVDDGSKETNTNRLHVLELDSAYLMRDKSERWQKLFTVIQNSSECTKLCGLLRTPISKTVQL